jgi:uncharacterized protein (TIGR03083 family)
MDIWTAVRDERLDLADRLEPLTTLQWETLSLCPEWRNRDVLGHVVAGAQGLYSVRALASGLLRHRFSFNRWIAADGKERGRQEPSATLEMLRRSADNRRTPPGAPSVSVLADVFIHAQDMYRPLGLRREVPESHLVTVADFMKKSVGFGTKKRIAGLRLEAADIEWVYGEGPQVTGSAEALVMMMAGRFAALDDLAGEGKETLLRRCSA